MDGADIQRTKNLKNVQKQLGWDTKLYVDANHSGSLIDETKHWLQEKFRIGPDEIAPKINYYKSRCYQKI